MRDCKHFNVSRLACAEASAKLAVREKNGEDGRRRQCQLNESRLTGFEARTIASIEVSDVAPVADAKYRIAYFADTVLPAPDSPEMMIDWLVPSKIISFTAFSATANT